MGFGRIRSMRWVWLIVALLLSVGARAAEPLSIYCERWQGFCEPDGRGFYFDLVRAVYEPRGYQVVARLTPYKRAVKLVVEGEADMTIGVYPNEVNGVVWPTLSAFADDVSVLMTKERLAAWQGEQSLRGKRVVWQRGWAYDKYIPVTMFWHEVDSHQMALQLLEKGRYDYYLGAGVLFREQSLPAGMEWRLLRWLPTYPVFVASTRGEQLARLWDEGLRRLYRDGTLQALYRRHALSDYFDYYRQASRQP
ncbi:substrate-binding periplasmic protein [Aeromonas simiae]|uniref:substrate-binding periplasmic protein n=1 Tax=Aeromonas simiae TaxID=218936 RepID=UPI002FC39260